MTQQLVPYATNGAAIMPAETPQQPGLSELMRVGAQLARSNFFADAKAEAQAVAKVLAGAELGIPPVASMMGIYFFQNKLSLSANLIAGVIKRSRRYDYRVLTWTQERCELRFFEGKTELGPSTFTMQDAAQAGLAGKDLWKQYTRNLLFARALTNGARVYCPDIFLGGIYTPEEMGADVNGETGEPLAATVSTVSEAPDPTKPQPRMQQAAAIMAPDPQAALKRFWQRALDLGYTNAEGKLKQSAVHAVFGVAPEKGALEQYRQARGATWAELTADLERLTAERAQAEADPDALPFDPPAEHCPRCGTETVDGECGACGMNVRDGQGTLLDAPSARTQAAAARGAH